MSEQTHTPRASRSPTQSPVPLSPPPTSSAGASVNAPAAAGGRAHRPSLDPTPYPTTHTQAKKIKQTVRTPLDRPRPFRDDLRERGSGRHGRRDQRRGRRATAAIRWPETSRSAALPARFPQVTALLELASRVTGVAKRVDTAAAAIYAGLTVDDLVDLDLSYTPPLGIPWDVLQNAALDWLRAHGR